MKKTKPLRFIQISDTHLRAQPNERIWNVDVDVGLSAVLARIKERHWPVDFLLATGDLVHDDVAAYPRLYTVLASLGVPVYCLPGNHDQPHALREQLNAGLVRWQRQLVHGVWQFILLDSSVPGSPSGHLAENELVVLDRLLAANPDHYAVVCLHHHPVLIGSTWLDTMVGNGNDLFAVLDRYPQVRVVLWGHIHQAFSARRGQVELLGVPSTCVQFKPGTATAIADDLPPGYRWFELDDAGSVTTGIERID
ncbi:MAG: phosphodiesterase [Candidatus Competibacteraceae bacterium]